MSGTSLDGIDVAIVDIRGARRIFHCGVPDDAVSGGSAEALLGVSNAQTHTRTISRLNFQLGELYARAVRATCEESGIPLETVKLIGCHGQTIYHETASHVADRRGGGGGRADRDSVVSDFRTPTWRRAGAGRRSCPTSITCSIETGAWAAWP